MTPLDVRTMLHSAYVNAIVSDKQKDVQYATTDEATVTLCQLE